MKLDGFYGTFLRALSGVVGQPNDEGLRERVSGQILKVLSEMSLERAFAKPKVGSYARAWEGFCLLDPERTPSDDTGTFSISFTILNATTELLVLQRDEAGGRVRVMVLASGQIGWVQANQIVPW